MRDLGFCVWPAVCGQMRGPGREAVKRRVPGDSAHWLCELMPFQVGLPVGGLVLIKPSP